MKISFTTNPAPANRIDSVFSSETCFGTIFREFASIFVPRNGIPSCFLFCGMVRSRSPSVCCYFCSTKRNSELFPLPRNGSEFASIFVPQYRIQSIFLLCEMVLNGFPRVFCSAEQPEFRRNKPIVPSIPSSME
jgi:hypothetical protein